MIKAKVTKNIMTKGSLINLGNMGITSKQIVFLIITVAVAGGIFFLLKDFNMNTKMTAVFIVLFVGISLSVIQIQGLSMIAFLKKAFKGVDKRPFCKKGIINQDEYDF